MKITTLLIGLFFSVVQLFWQDLYLRTFSDSADKSVIFLHGGPDYNSASFEATTAQVFADEGFYVIVYDRRGEVRSRHLSADFTFDEAIADINFIYDSLNISTASIIGNSFGGAIETKFAVAEKEKVRSLILVSAPVNLQETFKTIIRSCRYIYKENKDYQGWTYLDVLAEMDSTTIAYSSGYFGLAMRSGFYEPVNPRRLSKKIKQKFKKNADYMQQLPKWNRPVRLVSCGIKSVHVLIYRLNLDSW